MVTMCQIWQQECAGGQRCGVHCTGPEQFPHKDEQYVCVWDVKMGGAGGAAGCDILCDVIQTCLSHCELQDRTFSIRSAG